MKDTLHAYDQLMALDLKEKYPGINELKGIRTPTMGEVRLVHLISLGEPVPDEITNYCVGIVDAKNREILEFTIRTHNEMLENIRTDKDLLSITIAGVTQNLAVNFHRMREVDLYCGILLRIAGNLNVSRHFFLETFKTVFSPDHTVSFSQ